MPTLEVHRPSFAGPCLHGLPEQETCTGLWGGWEKAGEGERGCFRAGGRQSVGLGKEGVEWDNDPTDMSNPYPAYGQRWPQIKADKQ